MPTARARSARRFAYRPNLLVVDGGKGQLGVAERVVKELGLEDEIELASLAKQFEEVYRPGQPEPIRLRRGSDALYLLQRVRDEAHRFAISFHRETRGKRMTKSVLDGIPGLGPARKARLVKELGGVSAVRSAPLEVLMGLSWLPEAGGHRRLRRRAQPVHEENSERVPGGDGDVGGRTFHRSRFPGGPGLVRHRQPAGRPDPEDGRDGQPARRRDRAGGAGHRPGWRARETRVCPGCSRRLRGNGNRVRVLFLDASDEVLLRRYEGTRRRHPLAARGVEESIADERRLLAPVRDRADLLIDTGELNTNQLRSRVLEAFGDEGGASSMRTSVVSFGYKYGLPLDVDVVFDCRFLPNPFWIEELRPFSGLDAPVREYVLSQPETKDFLEKVDGLLTGILPSFVREGKSYLTIGLGCTGGRHRSVALAEALGERFVGHGYPVSVFHRDVER